jgi:hypothetical protein
MVDLGGWRGIFSVKLRREKACKITKQVSPKPLLFADCIINISIKFGMNVGHFTDEAV